MGCPMKDITAAISIHTIMNENLQTIYPTTSIRMIYAAYFKICFIAMRFDRIQTYMKKSTSQTPD
jgi:hypothetical protein